MPRHQRRVVRGVDYGVLSILPADDGVRNTGAKGREQVALMVYRSYRPTAIQGGLEQPDVNLLRTANIRLKQIDRLPDTWPLVAKVRPERAGMDARVILAPSLRLQHGGCLRNR